MHNSGCSIETRGICDCGRWPHDSIPFDLPHRDTLSPPPPTRGAAFFIAGLSIFIGLCFGVGIGLAMNSEWVVIR